MKLLIFCFISFMINSINCSDDEQELLQIDHDIDHMYQNTNDLRRIQTSSVIKSKEKLQQDFDDFINLIDIIDIKNLTNKFYLNDREVHSIINFMNSTEFITIRNSIFGLKEIQNFINYIKSLGVNFIEISRKIRSQWVSYKFHTSSQTDYIGGSLGGIDTLLEEILSIVPQDQMYVLFFEKMDSIEFSKFIEEIGSNELEEHLKILKNSKELSYELDRLKMGGVDFNKIIYFLKSLVGWV